MQDSARIILHQQARSTCNILVSVNYQFSVTEVTDTLIIVQTLLLKSSEYLIIVEVKMIMNNNISVIKNNTASYIIQCSRLISIHISSKEHSEIELDPISLP